MKVSVVTPYHRETLEQLTRCHDSVRRQTMACTHYLIADGHPLAALDAWDCIHVALPRLDDCGDTPRLVGAALAATRGAEAITFLDADNWYDADHVETLLRALVARPAAIATSARRLIRPDLSFLADCVESDGESFNDSNCILALRQAFPLLSAWGFKDPRLAVIGDRLFWERVKASGLPRTHSPRPTVNYVTTYAAHYRLHGEVPPPGAREMVRLADGHFALMDWEDAARAAGLAAGS